MNAQCAFPHKPVAVNVCYGSCQQSYKGELQLIQSLTSDAVMPLTNVPITYSGVLKSL